MTFAIYFGHWGGISMDHDAGGWLRVCLGWVAFLWAPEDLDALLRRLVDAAEKGGLTP